MNCLYIVPGMTGSGSCRRYCFSTPVTSWTPQSSRVNNIPLASEIRHVPISDSHGIKSTCAIADALRLVKKTRATFLPQLGVEHRPRVSRSSLVPCFQQFAGFVFSFRWGRNWFALSFTKLCWNLVWNETRKSNVFADEQSQFHSVTLIKSRLQFLHCQLSAIHSINSFHLNTACYHL